MKIGFQIWLVQTLLERVPTCGEGERRGVSVVEQLLHADRRDAIERDRLLLPLAHVAREHRSEITRNTGPQLKKTAPISQIRNVCVQKCVCVTESFLSTWFCEIHHHVKELSRRGRSWTSDP